ncbi:hypothetical protein OFC18_29135, partial [Escherichia coli]|nr:hypothetical protein [Escherichia coli]
IFIIAISCVVNRRFKLNFTPTTIQERKGDYSTVITLKIKISAEEQEYPQISSTLLITIVKTTR